MDTEANLVAEVMETERRWVQAHRDLDTAVIAEILDEDYVRILEEGTVLGKSEVVASYASGERHWDVAEGSDYSVHVFGDDNTAVVIGIGIVR